MDIEDAHKLKLLSTDEIKELFLEFFDDERKLQMLKTMEIVGDVNEQIAYMRSSVIGLLVSECSKAFVENEDALLKGELKQPLIKMISEKPCSAYKKCSEIAYKKLYRSSDVLDIELAGYKIISNLLDKFIDAVNNPDKSYSKILLDRIPQQYEIDSDSKYKKIMAILDYISGMTDVYALDLYRKINGMSLPSL